MNTVTVNQATLIVEPMGLDKLWSFKRRLEIPLAHVRGATFDPGINDEPKGIRWPGLSIPGKWSGTFRQNEGKLILERQYLRCYSRHRARPGGFHSADSDR